MLSALLRYMERKHLLARNRETCGIFQLKAAPQSFYFSLLLPNWNTSDYLGTDLS